MKNFILLTSLFYLFQVTSLFASEHLETYDFEQVAEKAAVLVENYPPSEVLVVFDIDNNLLRINQDLGTEQWFDWQAEGISEKSKSTEADPKKYDYLVADTFSDLVKTWGMLLFLSKTTPVQPNLPALVRKIQNLGVTTIALTSRGPFDHDYTIRELSRNEIDLSQNAVEEMKGFPGSFLPYDPNHPEKAGITGEEAQKLKLKNTPPKRVQFTDGVFLTEGQHKGLMLRTLLFKAKRTFRSILFVDNVEKHLKRVQEMFADQKKNGEQVNVTTIRYTREDKAVENFRQKDKTSVIQQWRKLQSTLHDIFVP